MQKELKYLEVKVLEEKSLEKWRQRKPQRLQFILK